MTTSREHGPPRGQPAVKNRYITYNGMVQKTMSKQLMKTVLISKVSKYRNCEKQKQHLFVHDVMTN